jgi:small subunit ribosomal protein S20
MAHHKSAIKRIRQSAKAAERNKAYKSELKTALKKVRGASNKEEAQKLYRETASLLDKLAGKGIIHKNNASNHKAKLAHVVNKLA